MLGIVFVLLLGLELAARRLLAHAELGSEALQTAALALPQASADEQAAFARELSVTQGGYEEQIPLRWSPLAYWRAKRHDGAYIQIGDDGLRRTVRPTDATGGLQKKVFLTGGSTMYGDRIPDEQTIPSCVWRALTYPEKFEITNFGQLGYVSTQQVMTIALECRAGNVPDVVVMYAGFNDALSTYQNVQAGLTMNEDLRRREFGSFTNPKTSTTLTNFLHSLALHKIVAQRDFGLSQGQNTKAAWAKYFATVRDDPRFQAAYSTRKAGSATMSREQKAEVVTDIAMGLLADDTIRAYAFNLRTLFALQEHYGFVTLIYWQPTLWTKSAPSLEEQNDLTIAQHSGERTLIDRVQQSFREARARTYDRDLASLESVIDLSDVFNAVGEKRVYLDVCHLNLLGNSIVAGRIAHNIEAALEARDRESADRP